MKKARLWLQQWPHHVYLLPVFFVLHGYAQNRQAITGRDVLELLVVYLIAAAILFAAGYLFFRNRNKAALFSFCLLSVHFFFGAVHDALKDLSTGFFLARYSVLLPLLAAAVIALIIFLKKTNRLFLRITPYLNLLLLVLLVIELPALFRSKEKKAELQLLERCPTCPKPDVYFIIADEYADSTSLARVFSFNNGAFQNDLRQRGFHVVENSLSNYNFTQYSVASIFKMDYLENLVGSNSSFRDINNCYGAINQNEVLTFFQEHGYDIKNFSLFNLANQPARVRYKFVPMGKELITSQTLLQRLYRDLGYHLVTTLKIESAITESIFYMRKSNEKVHQLLRNEIGSPSSRPRFVFAHFEMPHYPYYYDRNGNPRPAEFLTPDHGTNKEAYIEYLQYCNGFFRKLLDDIVKHSATPPIIVFMGDHGFREFADRSTGNRVFHFMNLNAVLLPSRDYRNFYPGMSGVNQFRAIMNSAFGQQLPYKKDSTIFIVD